MKVSNVNGKCVLDMARVERNKKKYFVMESDTYSAITFATKNLL
jgi:hypothetical protein